MCLISVLVSGIDELDRFVSSSIEIRDGNPSCVLCSYTYPRRNNVARHVEANHVVANFQCDLCDKVSPTRHALYYHKKKHL